MSSKAESMKGALSGLVDPCFKGCNHHYETLLNIPWRVYCKKGCKGDADNWNECIEECRETCYKDPLISGEGMLSNLSASMDRSPGAPNQSMFNVPVESYNAAIGKQIFAHNPSPFVAAAESGLLPSTSLKGPQPAAEERQVSDISSRNPDGTPSPVTEASA